MKLNLNFQIKNEKIDNNFLSEIIRNEFVNSCERIIIDSQPKFINNFCKKIYQLLNNIYSINLSSKTKELNSLLSQNKIDFVNNMYLPMFKLCSLALKYYNSKDDKLIEGINISDLFNYRPHCMLYQNNKNNFIKTIGKHLCGGNYIIVSEKKKINENHNNYNVANICLKNNSYIICTKCNKCYLDECFPILCCNCNAFYYSEVISDKTKKDNCYLSTWYKYHCKNINNEKMSCIKCGNDFWLKNNKLFCKNCKFEIEPINIIWTCLMCNSDFNSEAKVYNQYEFKLTKLILEEALIYKKIVSPAVLPCKCFQKLKIKETKFFHNIKNNLNNTRCKGVLYFSKINEKKYLVCSECFNIYSINKFKWICPICLKAFCCFKIYIKSSKIKIAKINNKNYDLQKNFLLNSVKTESKLNTIKKSPRNKERIISILDSENNIKLNNNNIQSIKINKSAAFISTNKHNLLKLNINKTNSLNNKSNKTRKMPHSILSYYSSSPIRKAKFEYNQINNISNNRYITNSNSVGKIKKIRKKLVININNNQSNNDLYDIKIKKRRNLSVLPTEIKSNYFLKLFQNEKSGKKQIKSIENTISNNLYKYNIKGNKENKKTINNNLNRNKNKCENDNKKTINNFNFDNHNINKNEKCNINENESKCFYFNEQNKNCIKNNENLISEKHLDNLNNHILKSQKLSKSKKKHHRNIPNKFEQINSQEIFQNKKIIKNKKQNKSFYLKNNSYLLLSKESKQNKIKNENSINEIGNIKRIKNKNIFSINNCLLSPKLKSNNKSVNTSQYHSAKRNFISKGYNDYLNFNTNNRKIIEYKNIKISNNLKKNYFNNMNINNLSKSNMSITNNNSKRINNKSMQRIKNCKIKNIRITIENPKIINNINYNLSFTNNIQQLSNCLKTNPELNSKLNENGITNITKDQNNSKKEEKVLKKFNIDDYTIITQLGQGSFGKIYLARDSNKNIFSLKKILLSEELDVKSVIEEYNMCYNLCHPNIIKIMGINSSKLDKTTYVVYVLMEVGISDWNKEINSLKIKKLHYSESELINILKQLVDACSFLQKNNISHRDIKPQNILVFPNKIYKLIDFGEARIINDKEKDSISSIQYSLKGTELYMSPLLFNGLRSRQIDVKHNVYKSDVYSLGLCMLYAAICLEKPLFEIRKIIEMEKIRNYINSILKENYSEKLINIIISMLEIHEENRPDFIELEKLIQNL